MGRKFVLGLTLIFFLMTTNSLFGKSAIILSSFGSKEPDAISSIMNIKSSKEIVAQPTHLFHMEQYSDLVSYVQGVTSIKQFGKNGCRYKLKIKDSLLDY